MLVLSGAGAVLAGLLVFSAALLYPAYAGAGPRLFGISPLRDQQLAGIVMVAEQLATLGACSYFLLRSRSDRLASCGVSCLCPSTRRSTMSSEQLAPDDEMTLAETLPQADASALVDRDVLEAQVKDMYRHVAREEEAQLHFA